MKILTICLYLLMLFYAFSATMIAPMLPVLIEQFNLSLGQGGLFMTFGVSGVFWQSLLGGGRRPPQKIVTGRRLFSGL